jgi:hypothetical protein
MKNSSVPEKQKKPIKSKQNTSIEQSTSLIELMIPIVTVSEANGGVKKCYKWRGKTRYKSEHWTDKHSRHKKQKGAVFLMLKPYKSKISLPCHITLTRFAPNKLDRFDNLPMSLKWILDACCAVITGDYRPGRADDNELIDVSYKQVINQSYSVQIRIQNLTNAE